MAGWYKQHTSELAALEMLHKCGRQDIILAWLRVTRWSVDHESDELPEEFNEDARTLEAVGMSVAFGSRCKTLLNHRARMTTSRASTDASVRAHASTGAHVIACDHQDKTRQEKREEERERESTREIAAAPPAPSAKPKRAKLKATSFDDWKSKPEHGELAKERGVDLDEQVRTMGDWLKATGKTYKDYDAFARNWLRRSKPDAVAFKAKSNGALNFGDNAPANAGLDYWLNSDHSRPNHAK